MEIKPNYSVTRHNERYVCRGDCVLSKQPDYFDNYFDHCKAAVEILGDIDDGYDVVLGEADRSCEPLLPIFDWRLDVTNRGLMILRKKDWLREAVFSDLFDVWDNQFEKVKTFSPKTHLLLWCATCLGNAQIISTVLKALGNQVPMCVLQSLLIRAIMVHSVELVSILLQHRALPNKALRLQEELQPIVLRPITACIHEFRMELSQIEIQNLDRILTMLISACQGGQSPFAPNAILGGDDLQALAFFDNIWSKSSKVATYLLEQAKEYLNTPFTFGSGVLDCQFDYIVSMMRVLPVLQPLAQLSPPLRCVPAIAIFSDSILPLMRAGCRSVAKSFEAEFSIWFISSYATYKVNNATERMWARPISSLAELLLESRGYNINTLKMDCLTNGIVDGLDAINAVLPFRLQAFARRAVLKQLPLGFHSRTSAIERLGLPKCQEDYLNFREFDVFPASSRKEPYLGAFNTPFWQLII